MLVGLGVTILLSNHHRLTTYIHIQTFGGIIGVIRLEQMSGLLRKYSIVYLNLISYLFVRFVRCVGVGVVQCCRGGGKMGKREIGGDTTTTVMGYIHGKDAISMIQF